MADNVLTGEFLTVCSGSVPYERNRLYVLVQNCLMSAAAGAGDKRKKCVVLCSAGCAGEHC